MAEWKDRYDSTIDTSTICSNCGQRYGEHYGMRCVEDGEDTFAAAPQAPSGQQAEPTDLIPMAHRGREKGAWLDGYRAALAGQQSERPAPAGQEVREPLTEQRIHLLGREAGLLFTRKENLEFARAIERAHGIASQAERPAVKEGDA